MNDIRKMTKGQLIKELAETQQRIADLKAQVAELENVLHEERHLKETLHDSLKDTLFVFDPADGKAIHWNEAFRKVSGYSDAEIRSLKAPEDYLHEEDLPKAEKAIQAALNGESMAVTVNFLSKDGKPHPAEYIGTAVFDDEGVPRCIIAIGRDISRQIEREKILKESRRRFQLLTENIPSIVWVSSATGKISYVSPNVTRLLGITPEEFVKAGDELWLSRIHPDDRARAQREIRLLYDESIPFEIEYRIQRKDGEWVWLHDRANIVVETGGDRLAYGVCSDITERIKVEKALRDSQEYLEKLTNSMGDAVLSVKMPERIIEWANDSFFRQTGYEPEECIGEKTEFLYPGRNAFLEGGIRSRKALNSGDEVWQGEQLIKRKNGEIFPIEYTITGIRNEKGEFASITAIARDITERKQTQEALQRSEESLKMAQQAGHIGSFDWDLQNNKLTWSDETFRQFGLEPGQIEPSNEVFESFIHPDDREGVVSLLNRVLNEGESSLVEARMFRADETEWIMRAQGIVYRNADGQATRFIGIVQDITKQREMEEQLRQSEKMRAIGQLAGGVAHDFNNQLSVIMGFADMLKARLKDEDLISFADDIVAACKRSRSLTSQMLAFARKGKIENEIIDIHEVIGEVVRWLEHSIDKRINIIQRLEANPSTTKGDKIQVQNALLNIAINARDAMPKGGDLIFRTTIVDLDENMCADLIMNASPGRYLLASVSDQGVGMDKETERHAFEPFFTTKKIDEGTGMGLAAVIGTAESHGGMVDLESEVGRGTTLKVYLPLVEEAASPRKAVGGQTKPAPDTKTHILLVDDEELVRKVCDQMLSHLGYKVTTARNGTEAIEYYRKAWDRIDLVIMDMVMPDLSGRDTYLAMREINPKMRSILSSGYSIDNPAQEALNEGVVSFIQKPFNMNEISEKVAEALAQSV